MIGISYLKNSKNLAAFGILFPGRRDKFKKKEQKQTLQIVHSLALLKQSAISFLPLVIFGKNTELSIENL